MIAGIFIIHKNKCFDETFLHIFAFIVYNYFGFIFLFFSFLFFYDIFSIVLKMFNVYLPYRLAFLGVFAFTSVVYIYGFYEANNIKIKKVNIESHKIERNCSIAFISDLHLGIMTNKKRAMKVYNLLKSLNADIIVSGGDLIDGAQDNLDDYINLLKNLPSKYGKYAVLGNHEYYAGKLYAEELTKKAGFKLLNNESEVIRKLNVVLIGTENISKNTKDELILLKNAYKPEYFNVFIKHIPIVEDNTFNYIDLQLSGHTHNGQIFPFGLLVKLVFKYTSGLYKLTNGVSIYVSNGTLTWGPPVRILAKPEITFISLKGLSH
jgi:predicted MPP superfamily phosphohydrolase